MEDVADFISDVCKSLFFVWLYAQAGQIWIMLWLIVGVTR